MRTFIIVFFIFFLLETGNKIRHISSDNYPRPLTRRDDVISFGVFVGIVIWSGWLLF